MSARCRRPGHSSESGAVAVLVAILATVLFGVAAIAVDLGNAMNRKAQTQTQSDLAALAGGGSLPALTTTPTASDPAVVEVAKYLYENWVYTDSGVARPTQATLAAKLVSTAPADIATYGHVYYGRFDSAGNFTARKDHLTVVSPSRTVTFGLARAIGFTKVTVRASATAALRSPGAIGLTLPYYAYDGCDWGQQVIGASTANSGPVNVYDSGDWAAGNGSGIPSLAVPTLLSPNASPANLAAGDTTTALTLSGLDLGLSAGPTSAGVTAVGFFSGDGSAPAVVPASAFVSAGPTSIKVNLAGVPAVANDDGGVYYIRVQYRVKQGPSWVLRSSQLTTPLPFVSIGSGTLYCNGQKSSGNFGTISVYRTDSTDNAASGWLPLNIAKGYDAPHVRLNVYSGAVNPSSCGNGDPQAVQSDTLSTAINCVVTDTGFPQAPATSAFVTGVPGSPGAAGRLTQVQSGCGGSMGQPPKRTVLVHGAHTVNNEVLSCYLTNGSTTIGQISSKTYSGPAVLDASIYASPRFAWVPVISQQPVNGKKSYPIVDFRAAFITGENATAYQGHPPTTAYYYDDAVTNGLEVASNAVASIRVVFIHPGALPPVTGGGQLVTYTGTGPKILSLVD